MIKTSIEVLAEPIGFDISHSDDHVQSSLLNGMGRGFRTYNGQNLSTQLCYVASKLNKDAEHFLCELVEFIKLNNKK